MKLCFNEGKGRGNEAENFPSRVQVMEEIVCRRAVMADVDALVEMRAAFLAEVASADGGSRDLRQALKSYFAATISTREFIGFVGVAGGEIVATSGLVYHCGPPSARNPLGMEAYVMNMYTVPAWRGRGIATRLLRELIEVARQSGCRRIRLHAIERASAIYTQAGFVPGSGEMEMELGVRSAAW